MTKYDGKNLKAKRIAKGLSGEDLAKMSGLTRQQIWNIENNVNIPIYTTAVKLAAALNCPLDELFSEV